jgi:hypothetical protein
MLIFECGRRGKGQEPKIRDIPEAILETAAWWETFRPGAGNLVDWNPTPAIVPHDDDARHLLSDARLNAEAEYDQAEADNDAIGTTVCVPNTTRRTRLSTISNTGRGPMGSRHLRRPGTASGRARRVPSGARQQSKAAMIGKHSSLV